MREERGHITRAHARTAITDRGALMAAKEQERVRRALGWTSFAALVFAAPDIHCTKPPRILSDPITSLRDRFVCWSPNSEIVGDACEANIIG
jgi:hypothetical protein